MAKTDESAFTDGIRYRDMVPEDAAEVEQVEKACFHIPWSRESFWSEAASEQTAYVLALSGSRVVGYGGEWIVAGEAQVTNVAVHPEFRGKGIGKGLMEGLIQRALARGATAMTLEVRPSNTAALALYEGFGLRSVGRRRGYYLDNGEDALILWNTKLSDYASGMRGECRGEWGDSDAGDRDQL